MANKKRIATTLGAMALTAVIAIGGTLAYLSTVTETKTNQFSSTADIKGKIEETEWDEKHPNGWTDYKPGEATSKDPKIVIEEGSAWTAMKLDFKDAAENKMDYARFSKYAAYDKINDGWKLIAKNGEGSELYMYTAAVDAEKDGGATKPLFNNITVNAGITTVHSSSVTKYFKRVVKTDENGVITSDETVEVGQNEVTGEDAYFDQDGNPVGAGSTLPKFSIDAKGYAIQTEGLTADQAAAELIKLANTDVNAGSNAYFTAL